MKRNTPPDRISAFEITQIALQLAALNGEDDASPYMEQAFALLCQARRKLVKQQRVSLDAKQPAAKAPEDKLQRVQVGHDQVIREIGSPDEFWRDL